MTRINDWILVQAIDDQAVVIVDESSGEEVVLPKAVLHNAALALRHFAYALQVPRVTPTHDCLHPSDRLVTRCTACGAEPVAT